MQKAWLLACFVFSLLHIFLIECPIALAGNDRERPAKTAKGSAPANFTQDQSRRLRQRDGFKTQLAQLRGAGKFAEALVLAEKMLLVDREVFGPDHPLVAQSLAQTAELHVKLHDFPDAKRAAEHVRRIQAAWYTEQHWRAKDARLALERIEKLAALDKGSLARLEDLDAKMRGLIADRHYEEALPLFQQKLKLEKEFLGDKYQDLTALIVLASQVQMRSLLRGESQWKDYADFLKTTRGPQHPEYARALTQLGVLLYQKGSRAGAVKIFDQAAAIYIDTLGAFDLDYAVWVLHLGRMEGLLVREPDMGEALSRQAADIYAACRGQSDPQYADCLTLIGQIQYQRGAYGQAEQNLKQAMEIHKTANGDHSREYAADLGALAMVYHAKHEPELARPLLEKASRIRKLTSKPPTATQTAAEIRTEITRLIENHETPAATELCRKLVEIDRKNGDKNPDLVGDLWRLASNLRTTGKPAEAAAVFEEAAAVSKKNYGPTYNWYRLSLQAAADIYLQQKNYALAEPVYQELETLCRECDGDKSLRFGRVLDQEGVIREARGDLSGAAALFEKTLPIYRDTLGSSTQLFSMRLYALAELYQRLGRSERAEPLMREGLESQESALADLCTVQSEAQRFQSLRLVRRYLDQYLTASSNADASLVYDHVLRWKGAALTRPLEDWIRDQPELKDLFEKLARASARISRLAFAAPAAGKEESWAGELRTLRNDKENLESEIARQSLVFRWEAQQRRLQTQDILRALPVNAAIVDYIQYRGGPGQERLAAFVLRADRPPTRVEAQVGSTASWRMEQMRNLVVQGRCDLNWLAELRKTLWQPLTDALKGADLVLIAPDGALAHLPFAMLPGSRPGTWLLEEQSISYITAGRQIVEIFGPHASRGLGGLLAVGAIDYGADTGGNTGAADAVVDARTRAGFAPLPGTGREIGQCRELYAKEFAGERATVLTGIEPTVDRVRRELGGGYRYVHLATHGFFESAEHLARFAATAASAPGLPNFSGGTEAFTTLPLLRSGLAFAGAGRPAPGALARDRGVMTAEEIGSFDLRGSDLIVLSACDTGLGTIEAGQGVLGLQRAFAQAGARTLVTSLWSVDDAATSVLMENFYRNLWSRHMTKVEALRQAQIAILREPAAVLSRREELAKAITGIRSATRGFEQGKVTGAQSPPVFWAAFVLSGDPR
jgi:CHAT domain-containing protein/tetratricopeptide (TPR) repeat protein